MTTPQSRLRRAAYILAMCILVAGRAPLVAAGRPVGFTAPDGTSLTGLLYEPSARPAPGVVLVHMLGRSKDEWGWFADRLQEAGVTVLALDLRGHGTSGGSPASLTSMVTDVGAAIDWLASRPTVRPGALGVVGASLGANLAVLAGADRGVVRAVALVSPSLDYRGVRLDSGTLRKLGGRSVWIAASTEDPYAVRTAKEIASAGGAREHLLSTARAHGTGLLGADPDLARNLMDWLRRTLVF